MKPEDLTNYIKGLGADLVGFAAADDFAGKAGTPPAEFVPGAKTVIVIGLKMVDAIMNRLSGEIDHWSFNLKSYLFNYHYLQLETINALAARYLEEHGYEAYPIQVLAAGTPRKEGLLFGALSFKGAAVAAGLGAIGKNTCLITPEYGPRVRWACLVTDADLPSTGKDREELTAEQVCGSCTICIDRCPVGALSASSIDKQKCQFWMDQCQCALCMAVCPKGIKKHKN